MNTGPIKTIKKSKTPLKSSLSGEKLDWDYMENGAKEELVQDKLEELQKKLKNVHNLTD